MPNSNKITSHCYTYPVAVARCRALLLVVARRPKSPPTRAVTNAPNRPRPRPRPPSPPPHAARGLRRVPPIAVAPAWPHPQPSPPRPQISSPSCVLGNRLTLQLSSVPPPARALQPPSHPQPPARARVRPHRRQGARARFLRRGSSARLDSAFH